VSRGRRSVGVVRRPPKQQGLELAEGRAARERRSASKQRALAVDTVAASCQWVTAPESAVDGQNRRRLGLVWGAVAGDRGVAARGIWWRRRERAAKPRGRATASKSASSWPGR
jgi:hypothetical protein